MDELSVSQDIVKVTVRDKAFQEGYAKGLKDAVRHAHWIRDGETNTCSHCGSEYKSDTPEIHNYCSVCGFKMDYTENYHDDRQISIFDDEQ